MKETNTNNSNTGENKMAYMNQETKKEITPAVKAILKKYNVKGTLAVKDYSSLVLNIKSGSLDFITDRANNATDINGDSIPSLKDDTYIQINTYHIESVFTGARRSFLLEVKQAMNSVSHTGYTNINVGQWDKPYILQ